MPSDPLSILKTVYGYDAFRGRQREVIEHVIAGSHAFVLMPEHVHLLLTPACDITIERAIQLIKGACSHELGSLLGRKREIWQRGFTDHRIRNPVDFMHHRNYIHRNPVERKLVFEHTEYRCSSAFPGFKLDSWPSAAEAAHLKAS